MNKISCYNLEKIYIMFVTAICCILIGFYFTKSLGFEMGNTNDMKTILAGNNPGMGYFFQKNITYFLLITITPFINILLFVFQFLQVGFMISQIRNLSFLTQFTILYRHLIFEIFSLFISIFISYKYIYLIKGILNDYEFDKKKFVKKILKYYLLIMFLTLIAAMLEGAAYA